MFIIIELQAYADGNVGTLVNTYADRSEAENKYHLILAAAAVSDVTTHSAIMMQEDGFVLKSDTYRH